MEAARERWIVARRRNEARFPTVKAGTFEFTATMLSLNKRPLRVPWSRVNVIGVTNSGIASDTLGLTLGIGWLTTAPAMAYELKEVPKTSILGLQREWRSPNC